VNVQNKALAFMPAYEFAHYTDADMAALIAYMESFDPVDNTPAAISPGPVSRILYLMGAFPLVPADLIDHEAVSASTVAVGATVEYGEYLATGCRGCHGDNYAGGPSPGFEIPPANITFHETGIAGWTLEDFTAAMREGTLPDGTAIDVSMPWQNFGQMSDVELEAMYLYLESLPEVEYGS
jgi:mono/diheme cytochrome c family protein